MPTRKDKTNVAPIYREQVFIPASGATLMKQQARPKIAGRPVSSGAVEIVSPEFDLLTGVRGIANLPKGFLKTNKLPQGENLYYRQLDKSSKGLERARQVGVIDTKSAPPTAITLSSGKTIRIGKTFNTPFFAKGHLWYDKVDDMDVIVGKDNPLLDWKTITKGGGVTTPTPLNSRRTPFYMGEPNQAPTELFELYRRYPGLGYRNVTYGFPTIPITGLNTAAEQMKCGGRRKAQLGLSVTDGGALIPIGKNMFLAQGRTHAQGGIGLTFGKNYNPKGDLEIEKDELVQIVGGNNVKFNGNNKFKGGGQEASIRVFSSVPLLRGASPAELVLQGYNPDDVFKAQEEFKDRNRINDDGTRYEMGGTDKAKTKNRNSHPVTGILPYGYSIRNLYAVENPYRKGIKGNVAKMYDSRTLGAGVDVVSGHPELYKKAKAGRITKKQADETAVIHLRKDDNAIRSNYADVYGKAAADTLSYGPRFLVAQARYQQGNVRKAWPAIHKALAKGNAKALKKAVLQVTPKDHTYRRKWIEGFKVYKYGGNMIYTVNGNVKNGLMSARPKAEWGKGKDEKRYKYDDSDYIFYGEDTPYGKIFSNNVSELYAKNDKNIKYLLRKGIKGFMDEAIKHQTNKRPQYYAEKRLPIAGSQSIAEKAGLARSGWSYADNEPISSNYMPNINLSIPDNYGKSSAPRRGETKSTSSKTTSAPSKYSTPLAEKKESLYMTAIKNDAITPIRAGMEKIKSPSPTGGQKEAPWVPQFNTVSTGDWIGLGSNLAGHIASYFANNALLKKAPMPVKPVMTQAAKLKTRYNINPELSETRETELVNRAATRRNSQSSNTSLAREQRIANEARNARNKLYGQKENIETQLINQDRLNRQSVMARNVAAYNDWLNKTYVAKSNQMLAKQQNLMGLISGIPAAVGNFLTNIDNRKATNNTIKAIAPANPNVDGRMFGIGDYYSQKLADGRVAIYDKNGKLKRIK